MTQHGPAVIGYRWMTLLLAAGFLLYQVMAADYSQFGGRFRFLTNWALVLSCASALAMLCVSLQATARAWTRLATTAAVMNVMVTALYWRLVLIDPYLVNAGEEVPPMLDYYLHGVGPALQILDALFIGRVFRRAHRAVPWLLAVILGYVLWAEYVLRSLNDSPAGREATGLPYPYLNEMAADARMAHYMVNAGAALAVLGALTAIGWAIRQAFPR